MDWPAIQNPDDLASPALLVDPDRVERNIERMINTVGRANLRRLRPHVKTHKMAEVVRMQLDAGIGGFKAATLAELAMAAAAGARDLLLAYQPVGPNIARLGELAGRFPETTFSAVTDDLDAAHAIAARIGDRSRPFKLFIDVDCGMHRTGIELGDRLDTLRDWIDREPGVELAGLHVYDGHLHQPDLETRRREVADIAASVRGYLATNPVPAVVVGGSPTFGLWAAESDWQCSPGTTLLWDAGYARSFTDLEFQIAACLLTRVISKPGGNRICIDLGHKSVAAENPLGRRVFLAGLEDAVPISQSEEHLVLENAHAHRIKVGEVLLGYPQHICPTVALHAQAAIVRHGRVTGETWKVAARDRV